MVSIPPPDDAAPPMNPAEIPLAGTELPPLPQSVSNLEPEEPEPPVISPLPYEFVTSIYRLPELWVTGVSMLATDAAAIALLLVDRITAVVATVLLIAGQAIGIAYVWARAWIAVTESRARDRAR